MTLEQAKQSIGSPCHVFMSNVAFNGILNNVVDKNGTANIKMTDGRYSLYQCVSTIHLGHNLERAATEADLLEAKQKGEELERQYPLDFPEP